MFSRELCGGTHLRASGQIGFCHIVSESSVGSGLRRIEAVTGRGAERLFDHYVEQVEGLASRLQAPVEELGARVEALLDELEQERKRNQQLARALLRREVAGLATQVQQVGDVPLLTARVEAPSAEALREAGDLLRDKLGSAVIVLGACIQDRPNFLAMVTRDLVARGLNAGDLVKKVAAVAGGGGGGRPEMAQAGGRDCAKLDAALAIVPIFFAMGKPSAAPADTVYLDRTDEIASIHDKLEAARGEAVVVVAPRSVRLLRSPIHLKLLRRSAEATGKQIALVAEDWLTRDLARQEGIPVFRSVRGVDRSAFQFQARPGDGQPTLAQPRPRRFRGRWEWPVRIGALVSLVVLVGLLLLSYPTATITLVPVSQELRETLTVTASVGARAIDLESLQIPARRLESRIGLTDRLATTGKKSRGDQRATGQVTLTNNTAAPINLPRGFAVQTVDGRRFAIQADVVIQPGARLAQTVPVQASEPGANYNVPPFVINLPADAAMTNRLNVINNEATQGGTDIEVSVVTADDIQRLRTRLAERLRNDVQVTLWGSRNRDESLYNETIAYEFLEEAVDKQVGDEAREVGMRMVIQASAIAFSGNDVNLVALRRLEQGVRPGFQVALDSLATLPVGLQHHDRERLTFHLAAAVKAVPRVDQERLKWQVSGRSPEAASAYLAESLQLAQPPRVRIDPAWMSNLPPFPWRIQLVIATDPIP